MTNKQSSGSKHFALIGRRLGHSYSKRYFETLFSSLGLDGYTYSLHECDTVDDVRDWVRREGISGFNVTIPFKEAIIDTLDTLDGEAAAIGAVNCVTVEGTRLVGHNTDASAFASTIADIAPALGGRDVLVLGTGGAAKAVASALQQMSARPVFVSRQPSNKEMGATGRVVSYDEAHGIAQTSPLIINCTPVGMYPDTDSTPWPWPESVNEGCMVYDLVYNPSPTLLIKQAAEHGAVVRDGLEMLHRQAALSWRLFMRHTSRADC